MNELTLLPVQAIAGLPPTAMTIPVVHDIIAHDHVRDRTGHRLVIRFDTANRPFQAETKLERLTPKDLADALRALAQQIETV